MAATTLASVLAAFARLSPEDQTAARAALAIPAARSASTSEASAHWQARDIACNAAKPCGDTFRTTKGRDWHVANVEHA